MRIAHPISSAPIASAGDARSGTTLTRRALLSAATAAGAAPLLQGCGVVGDGGYADAARATWTHTAPDRSQPLDRERELVRYATLAPSSHNTQCWRFAIAERHITVLPDLGRRCPVVDPDDHHLFVSLGCATENMVQAGQALGLHGHVAVHPAAGSIDLRWEPAAVVRSELFDAIPQRQCTRTVFNGVSAAPATLALLEHAGQGEGVHVVLLTARPECERMLELVTDANGVQLRDPAFMAELTSWIRFNGAEAVATRDGLYTVASGNRPLPRWVGRALMPLFFTVAGDNDTYAREVRSSAGIAAFVSDVSDRTHWIEVGRCYQRFALQATALGLRTAMLNQPVEVAASRPQVAAALGLTHGRPDLVVRFGYAPAAIRSLRRPVDAVIA